MLTAAFLVPFSGFLRVSEFTAPLKAAFNPRIHPTRSDIVVGDRYLNFHIKISKTDQLHQEKNAQIVGTGGRLCLRSTPHYHSTPHYRSKVPLFTFQNHKPLTRHSCLQLVKKLLQKAGYMPDQYNTHSFRVRIGAATHAAHVGISSNHIKHLGRWRSSVYQLYTRSGATTLKQAATHLASSLAKYC